MPQAEKAVKAVTPQAGTNDGENKTGDKPKSTVQRTNFSKKWPEDAAVTLLVAENPKKEGSKARERFQHYFSSKTVGDYRAAGGTYQDIAYDLGREFIKIG